jgi:hypothetical protein
MTGYSHVKVWSATGIFIGDSCLTSSIFFGMAFHRMGKPKARNAARYLEIDFAGIHGMAQIDTAGNPVSIEYTPSETPAMEPPAETAARPDVRLPDAGVDARQVKWVQEPIFPSTGNPPFSIQALLN